MRRIVSLATVAAVGGAISLWSAEQAEAASTRVHSPFGNEASHAEIFGHLYGGSFSGQDTAFTNGGVTVRRVDDGDDQFVSPGSYEVQAVAAFAEFDHRFGYLPGRSGNEFVHVLDTASRGFNVNDSAHTVSVDQQFRWARRGQGATVSSRVTDNSAHRDHIITYAVDGSDERLLFIEDLPGSRTDWDFQDLVIRVTPVNAGGDDDDGAHALPTPTAAGSGLALLIGTMLFGRGRNRDRRG